LLDRELLMLAGRIASRSRVSLGKEIARKMKTEKVKMRCDGRLENKL
jgi:hypothetical protein